MKSLSSKIGFEKLLALYCNGNDVELEHVVGKNILLSINKYFDYYEKFLACSGKSLREA
jgi:hypothetical protein